jgi:hypothetical protein
MEVFMKSSRLMIALFATSVLLSAASASAFTLDNKTNNNADGTARFSDPDSNIPFPHVADDGSQSQANFQPDSASFGFAPLSSNSDAFERAQNRMQQ